MPELEANEFFCLAKTLFSNLVPNGQLTFRIMTPRMDISATDVGTRGIGFSYAQLMMILNLTTDPV